MLMGFVVDDKTGFLVGEYPYYDHSIECVEDRMTYQRY